MKPFLMWDCEQCRGSATLIAEDGRSAIQVVQLTASAGIAPVKFLQKSAVMRTNPMVNLDH